MPGKNMAPVSEPLHLLRLAIIPTLKCTLRCRLCSNYMTMYDDPPHVPVDEVIRDIDNIFALVDHTEWLQFVGGEIFLHRDMDQVYLHCLRYRDKFNKLILIINATVLPDDKTIDALKLYGECCQVQISDYGKYSCKLPDILDIFKTSGIPFVVKRYHGKGQHCGGWVDNNHFDDRGKSEQELREQFENCGQIAMQNFHLFRGKFHGCARSLMASALGKIVPAPRDFIDLNDDSLSPEEKREVIRHFNDSPRVSCRSCVSFGEDVERFPAAEQL